jgi:cobalt-zinc-cadmium efflux system outer membrane protein
VRSTAGLVVLACGLAFTSAGCRSAGEGSPAGDVASVSADVARRTRTSASAPPCDDTSIVTTCHALLGKPLTEESAVKVALLGNASVRESYERLGIARADLLQAGLISNPVFSASAKFFSAGPEVELGVAQSFVEIFFVPLRRRVAAADLCAAQAEVARDLVRLVYDVRRELVRARAAEEVVRVRREALDAVGAARDLMKKLHEAGNVRDADLTVEQVGAARAQMDLDAALLGVRDARERMSVLLGACAAQTAWTVDGTPIPLPEDAGGGGTQARALAASLDLLENKARIQSALVSAGLARSSGLLPKLDLGAVGKREPDGAWGFGPEVSTAIPIFDTGVAKTLAANATARQGLARHERLTVEIGAAARRLSERVKALRAREAYLRETYLPLRKRLVDETMQTFNAMQIGAFDVIDAREGEADARREYAETRAEAWLAILDLAELGAGSLNRERVEDLHLPENAERPAPPKGH